MDPAIGSALGRLRVPWIPEFGGLNASCLAVVPDVGAPGAPLPLLGHSERVELLRNVVDLARSCDHCCLPPLRNVIESRRGPLLVHDRAPGELIGTTRSDRGDPAGADRRFAHLPPRTLLDAFGDLIELHQVLAAAGWVAVTCTTAASSTTSRATG